MSKSNVSDPLWLVGNDGEPELRRLYERHYSSRIYKDGRQPKLFCGPGQKVVLTTPERDALFVWRKFKDDSGQQGVNCAVFRNESNIQSSELVRQADRVADFIWPGERHYTYVCAKAVASRNPGYCFKCAGWNSCGMTKGGLLILERQFMQCKICGDELLSVADDLECGLCERCIQSELEKRK